MLEALAGFGAIAFMCIVMSAAFVWFMGWLDRQP